LKILLLQLKRIGDLILTTPAIRCLREAYPQARLVLVTDAANRGLLRAIDVDECLVHDKRAGSSWIWKTLPGLRPDWVLDFSGTDRAAFFCALSRGRRRVNFARFRTKFLRPFVYSDFVDSSVRDRHTADHYTDLLRPLGITREGVPLDIRPPAAKETTDLLGARGVRSPFAVIHAGTARPEKYWLPERWAAIADELRERHGLHPVFTGANSTDEQTHLSAIRAVMRGPATDLSGTADLAGLAGIISRARIFCGVDTAAMHLADAAQTPLVALFGPTNPYQWRPRHARATVLRARTIEPFTVKQKGGPMAEISVREVDEALQETLRATA
jgi:ADP-heptose:LPS heptosyltransferase